MYEIPTFQRVKATLSPYTACHVPKAKRQKANQKKIRRFLVIWISSANFPTNKDFYNSPQRKFCSDSRTMAMAAPTIPRKPPAPHYPNDDDAIHRRVIEKEDLSWLSLQGTARGVAADATAALARDVREVCEFTWANLGCRRSLC